jgi:hypothetical protein
MQGTDFTSQTPVMNTSLVCARQKTQSRWGKDDLFRMGMRFCGVLLDQNITKGLAQHGESVDINRAKT